MQPIYATVRLGELEQDADATELVRDITELEFKVDRLPDNADGRATFEKRIVRKTGKSVRTLRQEKRENMPRGLESHSSLVLAIVRQPHTASAAWPKANQTNSTEPTTAALVTTSGIDNRASSTSVLSLPALS